MITARNMKTKIEKKRTISYKRNPNFGTRRPEPRN